MDSGRWFGCPIFRTTCGVSNSPRPWHAAVPPRRCASSTMGRNPTPPVRLRCRTNSAGARPTAHSRSTIRSASSALTYARRKVRAAIAVAPQPAAFRRGHTAGPSGWRTVVNGKSFSLAKGAATRPVRRARLRDHRRPVHPAVLLNRRHQAAAHLAPAADRPVPPGRLRDHPPHRAAARLDRRAVVRPAAIHPAAGRRVARRSTRPTSAVNPTN